MTLRSCIKCGGMVSTRAEKCPNCGAPVGKKKRRFSSRKLLVPIFLAIIAIFAFWILSDHRKSEKGKGLSAAEKKAADQFVKTIDVHYEKLSSLYKQKKWEGARKEARQFKKYEKLDYKNAGKINKKIKIHFLDKEARQIPAAQAESNLKIYKKLLALDPGNGRYKKKVARYRAAVRKNERKRDAERKE